MGETILVIGGARSGKSRKAEELAGECGPVVYLATACPDPADAEMAERIARHQGRRPADWTTREHPRDLDQALAALVEREGSVLIDCATLWITNLMLGLGGGPPQDDAAVLDAVDRALSASRGRARVVWVSNEVGSGVVPENALARRFADLQGLVNQRLAAVADAVHLCVAGLSLRLK